jgi:integrase/recombinase XerD
MKRPAMPTLSVAGQQTLDAYADALSTDTDASSTTVRNYLSDLRQFIAWCESIWAEGQETAPTFTPTAITTPLLTRYRAYLQHTQHLKPASVNRALISTKRYVAWAVDTGVLGRNVAAPVKLIPYEPAAPRHLNDHEEEALLAAVTATGGLRDQTIIILMLHTGLRAREVCTLRRDSVTIGKRSGFPSVYGKRNKYREVPLNATARAALTTYLATLTDDVTYLFPSEKTGQALTERALGHLIKKYATHARLVNVSPHDLRHRFGYRMAATVPLHRLAQMMGHDSLDTTMIYIRGTRKDLQTEVEKIAWS